MPQLTAPPATAPDGDRPPTYTHAPAMTLPALVQRRTELHALRHYAEVYTFMQEPVPEALTDAIHRWADTIAVLTLLCSHGGCPVWVDTTAPVDDTTTPTPGTCHTHTAAVTA